MAMKNRPFIIVPQGLKDWFRREACPEGATMFAEIREVDPTLPGLPEFEEAISADFELEEDPPAPAEAKPKPQLQLVTFLGRRLEP